MKAEIILAIVCTSFCICDRQQRSTVLTDEYKRVLEHFDFSNFDKQEALNYIDRQRYENQIRGKRSHSKFKRDHGKTGKTSDLNISENDILNKIKMIQGVNTDSDCHVRERIGDFTQSCGCEPSPKTCTRREPPNKPSSPLARAKRGRRAKKKHRSKSVPNDWEEWEEDEEDEGKYQRHKKRRKKKKRKRRYWDAWSEWSPCSVTCGRGRKIRWRKCIAKNCTTGEFEMGEKTCQLPACNLLTKLLGL